MNQKARERWTSPRLGMDVELVRWGHFGQPVLVFPTAGGDAEEIERFGLVESVRPFIDAGRVKIYSVDSIAGRTWLSAGADPRRRCWVQNRFDGCIAEEVLPAIINDCGGSALDVITAGCSIGAFNALATLCRHPERFALAIAMSGTYDLERFLEGYLDQDFYFSSPMHWLPNLEGGPQLDRLRERFVLLALAGGRWEDPRETTRMAEVLAAKQIPHRVDTWGTEFDHDWPTWRQMFPRYLDEFLNR